MAANHDAALGCELKRIGLNLGRSLQNLGPAHLRSGVLSRSPLHPRFVMLFKLIRHFGCQPTATTPPVSAPLLKRVHQLWRMNKGYRAGAKRKSPAQRPGSRE